MRSRLPKVLHPVCGRPMLDYVIEAATEGTGQPPIVVISPATGVVRDSVVAGPGFAIQEEPRGTADAVRAALEVLPAGVTEIVVLSGDVPLVTSLHVTTLLDLRREEQAVIALATVDALIPDGLGRVVRDAQERVERVVEERDATEEQLDLTEINVGLYAFDVAWLRRRLPDIPPSPVSGELYLPILVEYARADRRPVAALELPDDGTLTGINDRAQLSDAEIAMRLRINDELMRAGVTMADPASTFIDATVELAEDVALEANVSLRGATRVGRDSAIRAGSYLVDSVIGERCVIWASVLESATVEDDARVGPFAHLRPGARVGAGAEVGNFAEIKSATLGARSKQHHFSYLGDAQVGAGVNIGAGTITANYDGQRKHRTVMGDGAFIGSGTILRAPVTIGEGAVTGAGSVVTHDVPAHTTVLGVPARPHPAAATSHDTDPDPT
jgi:bifunctional UDP-N-acetylglucosamine pyrophosphorylase / glucosamine-1-phosphate N-acetyltransferase